MSKMFMVDLETTGVSEKTDDVLQIGMLELDFIHGYWVPGRVFNRFLGTRRQPSNTFAREKMSALYAKCNLLPLDDGFEIKTEIANFLTECGAPSMAVATGINVANFDLAFLFEKGYAVKKGQEDNNLGTFHYTAYEISGARNFAMNLFQTSDRKAFEMRAMAAYPEIALPMDSGPHDAVYDCYAQARLLNGMLRLCQRGFSRGV